ncbi:MAG: hypothetical protein V7K53_01500 [Nostoc sp.]
MNTLSLVVIYTAMLMTKAKMSIAMPIIQTLLYHPQVGGFGNGNC